MLCILDLAKANLGSGRYLGIVSTFNHVSANRMEQLDWHTDEKDNWLSGMQSVSRIASCYLCLASVLFAFIKIVMMWLYGFI